MFQPCPVFSWNQLIKGGLLPCYRNFAEIPKLLYWRFRRHGVGLCLEHSRFLGYTEKNAQFYDLMKNWGIEPFYTVKGWRLKRRNGGCTIILHNVSFLASKYARKCMSMEDHEISKLISLNSPHVWTNKLYKKRAIINNFLVAAIFHMLDILLICVTIHCQLFHLKLVSHHI